MVGDALAGLLSSEQVDGLRSATVVLLDRFFADVGHLEAGWRHQAVEAAAEIALEATDEVELRQPDDGAYDL